MALFSAKSAWAWLDTILAEGHGCGDRQALLLDEENVDGASRKHCSVASAANGQNTSDIPRGIRFAGAAAGSGMAMANDFLDRLW